MRNKHFTFEICNGSLICICLRYALRFLVFSPPHHNLCVFFCFFIILLCDMSTHFVHEPSITKQSFFYNIIYVNLLLVSQILVLYTITIHSFKHYFVLDSSCQAYNLLANSLSSIRAFVCFLHVFRVLSHFIS